MTETPTLPTAQQIALTNARLFDLWFPIDELGIPTAILPEITAILAKLEAGMLASPPGGPVMTLLAGLTDPRLLPFYPALQASTDPAIVAFLAANGGIGGLDRRTAGAVLSCFFDGLPEPAVKASAMVAMLCRELYLSTIWDLPLAVPLTGIQQPSTFVSDTALYAKINYPVIPESWLAYDAASGTIRAKEGTIDYLVIGSGPAGATMASELRAGGKRVVLVEQGPFVVWGSMDTMSYGQLMFRNNTATTVDNGILVRSGQAMGGGTTVNIDLAFSPLEATIQSRIANWIDHGWIDGTYYTQDRLSAAYRWVRNAIQTRAVTQSELNRDNRVLWDGANQYGVDPDLYHLNRFPENESPSPVTQKRDAARQLIRPAMEAPDNPLAVMPDTAVQELLFEGQPAGLGVRCTGARLTANAPWTEYGNTIVDPCGLGIPPGTSVTIAAENVILSAGTIGSTHILLNTARNAKPGDPACAVVNDRVGRGLIMHPSFPLIGTFNERINLLEGLDSASFLEAFGVTPGFIFETMSGLPAYGALLIPGTGKTVYEYITRFNHSAGFGVMLVDTPSEDNLVRLDAAGNPVLVYALSEGDKERFRVGVRIAIEMMFLAGAEKVIIPTNENVLEEENFDPMAGAILDHIDQAKLVEKNLKFLPNRTLLTSAHLQATNKLGLSPETSVASPQQRIWNRMSGGEIPNLYLMDSSMFPTSVGANPMQSLYTFAKIFAERLLAGEDGRPAPIAADPVATDRLVLAPEPRRQLVPA